MKRVFGRDYVADPRDAQFCIPRRTSKRQSKHWRLGPQTDQGATPHCVGHAWWNWFAASPIRQHPITPDGIYTLAQYFDEWEGVDYDGTSVRGAAKVLSITGHIKTYQWAWDAETAVDHILDVSPVVIGVNWYSGMMVADEAGYITPKGRVVGGHAVLVYGAHRSRGYVSIRNSWGAGWGQNGNCRLSIDDFNRLLGEDGECCTAVETAS